MTYQAATIRLHNGEALFVHTPEPPNQSFYFFASQFTPISLAVGRRLRKLKGIVMLIKNTAEHLNSPYFYWKLPADVTREEVHYSADLFCRFDRFEDAHTLRTQFPTYFTPPLGPRTSVRPPDLLTPDS